MTCDKALAPFVVDSSHLSPGARIMRRLAILPKLACLIAPVLMAPVLPAPALAAPPAAAPRVPTPPDPAHGERIARRWCAACHVVAADQKEASADVPSFFYVGRHMNNRDLTSFLTDPHLKMPDMSLTRREIRDLTAYIRSLAKAGGEQ
jgi:mono/diheme cytochrome c family protein